MRVSANYTYKNEEGKKSRGSHKLDYRISDDMEREVLDELLRHDIKEKTGRVVKKFTLILYAPDDVKQA